MAFSSLPGSDLRISRCDCFAARFNACITIIAFAVVMGFPFPAAAELPTVVCTEFHDSDLTRAVLTLGVDSGQVHGLEVMTPDLLWSDPDQPETRRFPAGKTDVSPDLAIAKDVAIRTTRDADGELRIVDFAVTRPMALAVEGFRGSLIFHDGFINNTLHGSLYYTATGNILSITPLACKRY